MYGIECELCAILLCTWAIRYINLGDEQVLNFISNTEKIEKMRVSVSGEWGAVIRCVDDPVQIRELLNVSA